ncbi:TPA: hypothetical protein DD449_04055 [Candidatus Berkelbacteria bacterium]|uniref:DivTM protein n=1 Tax=Berkelbacteria bacterium GW2011_GWE1_39_12 TaxID=1618337 RepID=A0A0G4B328_9BACT|nr:MAG: divTM protein [Berkelbacteria bacterium GW2011_GWE1_39_12]HBO60831.1 hypothetical protein [Candidatus Berkelbacteria bacterium]
MQDLFIFLNQAKAQSDTLVGVTEVRSSASNFSNVHEVVAGAITWITVIASALLLIAIIYSGIMYITSGGDQTKAENAKKNLLWAIIGMFVILFSYTVIEYLPNFIESAP